MKTLVLAGSGEFTPAMSLVDKLLLSKSISKKVAIIPLASGQEHDWKKWIESGEKHFKELNAEPIGLPVANRQDAQNEEIAKQVEGAGIIYFSGGQPGYLMESLEDTVLWTKVYERYQEGTILAGSSAGAMIMGKFTIGNVTEAFEKGETPIWTDTFGLINFTIMPHFNLALKENPTFTRQFISHSLSKLNTPILGIYEDTALVVTDEKEAEVIGKEKAIVITKDKELVYQSGDFLTVK